VDSHYDVMVVWSKPDV